MKKTPRASILLALALLAWGCTGDGHDGAKPGAALRLLTDAGPAWQYENLRLYPVVASEEWLAAQEPVRRLALLSEAMAKPGFRLMERKQFGRSEGEWYNALTVQNKTPDTVLLFSGEVVQGGNQDRVLARHEVVMPRSVRNIEVYCVEAGRSSYYDPKASSEEKAIAAFNGYFSVASPRVRSAVAGGSSQQRVWDAVAHVTEANDAHSDTRTYAALGRGGTEAKKRRDAYMAHFARALDGEKNVVGVVAVCGDRVLGVDILGHSDLFARQFRHFLHGYVAEAAALAANGAALGEEQVGAAFWRVAQLAQSPAKGNEAAGKFEHAGRLVHLYQK